VIKSALRFRTPWLPVLALLLLALRAFAQVPQDMTFTGRLVDNLGNPLASPVNLELRVFDTDMGGTALYTEEHNGTALDTTGGFSVQLGLGTSPVGTFDAALFSDVDRWLEVVVGVDVLTPRQIIGSVPWALIAQQVEPWDGSTTPRFEDCGDSTVADHQTGLQWEKKMGTVGTTIICETAGCPDPHDVNNLYDWSDNIPESDGAAFTDFLARLNGEFDPDAGTGCFAGHCDWELPKISELQTILIGPEAAPGQATTCSPAQRPCIDPGFAMIGGPTASSFYWSASELAGNPLGAWLGLFDGGGVGPGSKSGVDAFVRAVRAGSCQ